MKKQEFKLGVPEVESKPFTAKCRALGITRTSAIRAFIRLYPKFPEADFCVLPVMKVIALGRVAKKVSDA